MNMLVRERIGDGGNERERERGDRERKRKRENKREVVEGYVFT